MNSNTVSSDSKPIEADSRDERAPNTLLNALIGAAVSVLLGVVPFSPVLGGGVAGYLEGGDLRDGGKVGVISGVLAAIPLTLVIALGLALFAFAPEGGALGIALLILALVVVVVGYTALLSLIGGVLGVYIKNEF